ncbi:MAG: addiction module antidote protein, HigA family [candidate division SR1 bacterium]|nr:MAG: addiction module antidote protein, HigA family [candidate division SR1 bacterium]
MKYEHPGVGLEMTLDNLNISQKQFAEIVGKSPTEVNHIINGRRAITPDWAFRICAVFGGKPSVWLSLQAKYDEQEYKNSLKYPQFLEIQKKAKKLIPSFA